MILGAAQSRVAHVFVTTELMRQEGPKVKVIFGYIVNLRPCHMQTTTSTPQKYCVSLGLSFSVCYVGWSLISCLFVRLRDGLQRGGLVLGPSRQCHLVTHGPRASAEDVSLPICLGIP